MGWVTIRYAVATTTDETDNDSVAVRDGGEPDES